MPSVPARPMSRRDVLKGAGVTLALPLLDAMTCRAAGAAAAPRTRMVVFMNDLGMLNQYFFPKTEGPDYEDTRYLKILGGFRGRMTVLSGAALPFVDGQHDADVCYLTGTPRPQSPAFRNGESLDVLAGKHAGKDTRYPFLAASNHPGRSMTFNHSGAKVPAWADPLALFKQLFVDDPGEAQRVAAGLQQRKSILDAVLEQQKALHRQVSAADRRKLDQYYTAVRDAEAAIQRAIDWAKVPKPRPTPAPTPPVPAKYSNNVLTQTAAFARLIALALQTDQTRVATVLASGAFGTNYQLDGKVYPAHGMSHHNWDPEKVELLAKYEEALLHHFREFLEALDAVREDGKSLLDRTIVTFGSCLSDGHSHSQTNLPTVVVGGGFKHRGHLKFAGDGRYPLTNLYLSMLHKMGVEVDKFSTSTGTMRGLEA